MEGSLVKHISEPIAAVLRDLASRVERNVPQHRDPHAFHAEKSEIASELRRLASAAEASLVGQ